MLIVIYDVLRKVFLCYCSNNLYRQCNAKLLISQ